MAQDPKLPADPGVDRAREAAPSPNRTDPLPAAGETAADAAGDADRLAQEQSNHPSPGAREELQRSAAPAPIRGRDVNDTDDLESSSDRFLGEPTDTQKRRS